MKTRNGKIARLPLQIREQLNARLADGEPGNRLVEWLNSNPDVTKVMAEQFEGRPITDNNLSEWRAGGYEEWLTLDAFLDETRILSENAGEVAATGISSDHLHIVLLAHHARLLKNLETMPENEFKTRLNTVRKLTASIMNMRRDELQRARLELQRERLEFLREKESMKSASAEAIGSQGVGRGAGGGNGKARESAGGGPEKSRPSKSASTSAHARSAQVETAPPANPIPASSLSDIRPGAQSSPDEDPAPPLPSLNQMLAPEISMLFGRIQSEFPDLGVELPALHDWLNLVGLCPDAPVVQASQPAAASMRHSKAQPELAA